MTKAWIIAVAVGVPLGVSIALIAAFVWTRYFRPIESMQSCTLPQAIGEADWEGRYREPQKLKGLRFRELKDPANKLRKDQSCPSDGLLCGEKSAMSHFVMFLSIYGDEMMMLASLCHDHDYENLGLRLSSPKLDHISTSCSNRSSS